MPFPIDYQAILSNIKITYKTKTKTATCDLGSRPSGHPHVNKKKRQVRRKEAWVRHAGRLWPTVPCWPNYWAPSLQWELQFSIKRKLNVGV